MKGPTQDVCETTSAIAQQATRFGGAWTQEKLQILRDYLDFYTTALKDQPFRLAYIDAFAGSGKIEIGSKSEGQLGLELEHFIRGSAELALRIEAKAFDELVFVEKDCDRCRELEQLRSRFSSRSVKIEQAEANLYLQELDFDRRSRRGVIFLDPFATQVEWRTIVKIAKLRALDMWLLFPVSALQRMLPSSRTPDDISPGWSNRLTRVYGDDSWRNLYQKTPQMGLFDDHSWDFRERGVQGLTNIFKENLKKLFGKRFLENSRTLKNSRDSPLFEFIFCVGSDNPAAIQLAKKGADYIIRSM